MANTERKFVLVNNTASHIDGCVVMDGDSRKTVILYPGHNEVVQELWNLLSANPVMKDKISAKKIVEYKKSFSEITAEEAAGVVAQTSDPRLLKIWKEKDARPQVRTAIEDCLKKIFGEKHREV
jgi:hypothetical protein